MFPTTVPVRDTSTSTPPIAMGLPRTATLWPTGSVGMDVELMQLRKFGCQQRIHFNSAIGRPLSITSSCRVDAIRTFHWEEVSISDQISTLRSAFNTNTGDSRF